MPKDIVAHVAYDGPALAEGSMDVRELAPALLGLDELLQEANRELNGDGAGLAVHVQSDFKGGSFQIDLGLVLTAYQHLHGLLTPAKAIAEYVGLVTGEQVSLLALLRWLRNRSPSTATQLPNGNVSLTLNVDGDRNVIEVHQNVYRLARNPSVRKGIEDALRPLSTAGVDRFEVRQDRRPIETITRDDLPAFAVPTSVSIPDPSPSAPRETMLQVIKPSFDSALRWVFSDGNGKFGAYVRDAAFNREVEAGRSFSVGDVLTVELRTVQHVGKDGKLESEHEVLKVIGTAKRHRQPPLLPEPG